MDFANPSYIQSDYMASVGGEQIAGGKPEGSVLHPTTRAKFASMARQQAEQAQQERQSGYANQPQYATMPQNDSSAMPYYMRSDIAPYSMNYPYASNSMAWGAFDATLSAQATPFKTALATSSLIVLGAVIGEYGFQALVSDKTEKFFGKNKLPKGIGALMGAITANAIRMGIASQLSSGWKPALTSLGGGMIPLAVPIAVTFFNKDLGKNKTKIALAIGGLGLLSVPFIIKLSNK